MSERSDHPDQKRPGFVRRFVRRRANVVGRMVNPTIGMDAEKNPVRAWSAIPGPGRIFSRIGGGFATVARIIRFDSPLSEDEQRAAFRRKAREWALTRENVGRVTRNIRVELFLYALVAFFGVGQFLWAVFHDSLGDFGTLSRMVLGLLVALFGITMAAVAGWRLDMIRQRRFRPFAQWIRGG